MCYVHDPVLFFPDLLQGLVADIVVIHQFLEFLRLGTFGCTATRQVDHVLL